jgi:Domain of unknown function (DUF4440)
VKIPSFNQLSRAGSHWRDWRDSLSQFGVAAALILTAVVLVLLSWLFSRASSDGDFLDLVSSLLLQVALIGVGAALIDVVVKRFNAARARKEDAAAKTLELLRRVRAAHVRIADAQRQMRADRSTASYVKGMRRLMLVTPDLEDIAEDVKAADDLFTVEDQCQIYCGIQTMVSFLNEGYEEYVGWSMETKPEASQCQETWIAELISRHGDMPGRYNRAVDRSKGRIRCYVYGQCAPARKRRTRRRATKSETSSAIALADLNVQFGNQESAGAVATHFFLEHLDEGLRFGRANGTVIGRAAFLDGLGDPRNSTDKVSTDIEQIVMLDRQAIVTCVVRMRGRRAGAVADGRYLNIRLFELQSNRWRCVEWFNRRMPDAPSTTWTGTSATTALNSRSQGPPKRQSSSSSRPRS